VAYLEAGNGAQLVRSELLGRLIKESDKADKAGAPIPIAKPFILAASDDVAVTETADEQTANNASEFADMFVTGQSMPVYTQPLAASELPRSLAGYDSVGCLILSRLPLNKLDAAQRQAILDFMTSGGTVLLASPRGNADPTGSWLAPYLPATCVGERYATQLKINGATTRPVVPVDIAEFTTDAAPAGSKVVAGDEQYVHLAYTPVGFGRLAVSSFPVTALSLKDPKVRSLWQQTLIPAEPTLPWDKSRLTLDQGQIMQAMVGLKAPPWTMAAGIVGLYVVIVLVIQLIARQSRRPMGFAAAIGVAILIAGGLMVVSLLKDKTVDLSLARISVTDLGTGGMRHEAVALLGDQDVAIQAVPGASLRDEVGGSSTVTLVTSPPGAQTKLQPRQIAHIWQATAATPVDQTLRVSGMFDADGLKLSIDNHAGKIVAPLLLSEGRHFCLPDVPAGQSTATASDQNLNPPGPPINSKAVQLEAEQLRGRILEAAMKPAPNQGMLPEAAVDSPLLLAGWYADPPPPLVTVTGQSPKLAQANAAVRTKVDLQPSPVGSAVKISPAFTRIINGQGGTLPYDVNKHEWIQQFNPQDFQIGFAVPSGIGKLRPTKVTLVADFNAPQHTVTIRRGQCPGGKVSLNPAGPAVTTWDKPLGPQTVTFDLSSGDYDANGWVWLQFVVETPVVGTAKWEINGMSMGYEATVEGPPIKPVLPARDAMPIPEPKPVAPKQPAPPKPPKPAAGPKSTTRKAPPDAKKEAIKK
jgi:hypothetical protein